MGLPRSFSSCKSFLFRMCWAEKIFLRQLIKRVLFSRAHPTMSIKSKLSLNSIFFKPLSPVGLMNKFTDLQLCCRYLAQKENATTEKLHLIGSKLKTLWLHEKHNTLSRVITGGTLKAAAMHCTLMPPDAARSTKQPFISTGTYYLELVRRVLKTGLIWLYAYSFADVCSLQCYFKRYNVRGTLYFCGIWCRARVPLVKCSRTLGCLLNHMNLVRSEINLESQLLIVSNLLCLCEY